MDKYDTISELSQAIESVENYMGDTPTYLGYGATLGEALTRYSKPLHIEVGANEIYTDFAGGTFYVPEENTITIAFLTDDIEPNDDNGKALLEKVMFTVRLKRAHTATPASRIHLVTLDANLEITNEAYYDLRIYDTNALRPTVQGDYEAGFLYWFYYNGTDVVINGMNQSATAQQVAEIYSQHTAVGSRFGFEADDDQLPIGDQVGYIILSPNAGQPQSSLFAKEVKFSSKLFSSFIAGSNSFLFDANGLNVQGAIDFSGAVVVGQDATEDEHFITYGQFKSLLDEAVATAIGDLIISDTTTPEESSNVPSDVADGVIYFQLAEEEQ